MEELEQVILRIFNLDELTLRIKQQIATYMRNGFTCTGMAKTLIYHFDINKNSIEKANGGIGIIPYVYEDAKKYYYNIWKLQKSTENIDTKKYLPKKVTVTIKVPVRQRQVGKLFSMEEPTSE